MASFRLRPSICVATFFITTCAVPVVPVVDVFQRNENGYFCIKIPSMTVLQDGSLFAMGEARYDNCEDWTKTDLVFKTSKDGITWSKLQILHSQAKDVVGNAGPVVVGQTSLVIPFCINNTKVMLMRSNDLGRTFTAPVDISQSTTLPNWKWVGLGPPSGLKLKSGRLVIPAYHTTVYEPYGPSGDDGCYSKGHAILSDDGGLTWRISADNDFGGKYLPNEPQAVELSGGRVASFSRAGIGPNDTTYSYRRLRSVSSDGGEHWEETEELETLAEPWGGCEGSTVSCRDRPRLVFAGPVNPAHDRILMSIFVSDDEGRTWKNHSLVDPGSSGYSSLAWVGPHLGLFYERSAVAKDTKTLPGNLSFAILPDPCSTQFVV